MALFSSWALVTVKLNFTALLLEKFEKLVCKTNDKWFFNHRDKPFFGRSMFFRQRRSLKSWMQWVSSCLFYHLSVISLCMTASSCLNPQMLSFMRAQYTLFQQGYNILDEIDPYMKKLAAQVRPNHAGGFFLKRLTLPTWRWPAPPAVSRSVQLDQLVIDSAMEKREMEHKHALIQQRVR